MSNCTFNPAYESIFTPIDKDYVAERKRYIAEMQAQFPDMAKMMKLIERKASVEWIEELIKDLTPTTEIFVKQMGTALAKEMKMTDRHGGNMDEFPEHLRLRNFPLIFKNKF